MRTLICRADGNASTGLGHLYRMFALYEIYKEAYNVCFVTRETSEVKVIPESYNILLIPSAISLLEEVVWLSHHFNSETDTVIADGYQFIGDYQKQLVDAGFYLMYIDDLVTEKLYANSIVNHAQKLNRTLFNAPQGSNFYLGTKYAILRPMFLEAAKTKRNIESINTVFVCFGGADALDLTSKAVEALLQFDRIIQIHVVLGGAYKHASIFKIAKENRKVQIHQNLNELDLITIMQQCNFAIVPSSTILYEICCVKMPVLSGYFVENQKNIYHAFKEDEVIYPGNDFSKYGVNDFREAIETILDKEDHNAIITNQSKLFDGKITDRFLHLMLSIKLRNATIEDSKLIFDWSNDDLVRQNSFNSEKLVLSNHNIWYTEKLKDKSCMFLVALVEDEAAGLVRFTIGETHTVVGITISKYFRGKQLASRFLTAAAKDYFKTNTLPIFAYIKKDNIASIKSFQNAGYVFLRETKVKGHDSAIYQLQRDESNT
ncbi:UDP-2,4-diacetamido-2,4,6-trideoxy-beta-L-altropyranose hydrolase [Winogradskyella sp. R77965]|uniref:UDP-2,4-diacetamido-2,4, 6-trideoxy-beta-L-altropyranose hydrolase n=1 Tax=Winogradskyella sp. R77965 TaxID=3093872 RepID=UPI0037DC9042